MNLFDLSARIRLDTDNFDKGIKNSTEKIKTFGEKLGKGLKTSAKIGTAAIGVATTAISVLVTKAVKNYANYEQLVGGVDTLFKKSSARIQQYAAQAYKTVGLSANEYMETVTGFSASLIQSLSGDTKKAAEYANVALVDMADNANKMGTDMTFIQNAYQGFAKQNYTINLMSVA